MEYQATLDSPLGKLGIRTTADKLTNVDFLNPTAPMIKPKTYVAKDTVEQLQCYFADPFYSFELSLELVGTDFQKKLWKNLLPIPVGKTFSYGELAEQLQSSPRAIGNACRVNPIPVIIPCHRVVAKDGLGGYAGETEGVKINRKKWLLAHEVAGVKTEPFEHKQPEVLFT